jgi:hypothetical protein
MSSLDGKDGKDKKESAKANEDVMGLDDGGDEKKLKLVSQEGDKFEVTKKVAIQSELVKTMAEGDKEENEIPLPNVKASVLKKVVEYMRYHVDNPAREIEKPLKSANMVEVVSQWDAGQPQPPPPPPPLTHSHALSITIHHGLPLLPSTAALPLTSPPPPSSPFLPLSPLRPLFSLCASPVCVCVCALCVCA